MLRTTLALLVPLWLALTSVAHADAPHTTPHTAPPPPPPSPSWHAPYRQGTAAYEANRFDEALADFQQARALGGPEELIYDIALTLDRLGRTQEAIAAYRQYLDAAPDADNRDVVESRLAQLEPPSGTIATHVAPPPGPILSIVEAPPATTTATTASTSAADAYTASHPLASTDHWEQQGPEWIASWVFLALTAATSVATVLVWQDGLSHFRDLQDRCAMGCSQADISGSSAHTSQDATNALLGVSIGLGAITVLTFILEGVVSGNRRRFVRGDASRDHTPHLSVGPMGFALSGTF